MPSYTPWLWSPVHKRHYSYLVKDDGTTILDTLWSGPADAPNVDWHQDLDEDKNDEHQVKSIADSKDTEKEQDNDRDDNKNAQKDGNKTDSQNDGRDGNEDNDISRLVGDSEHRSARTRLKAGPLVDGDTPSNSSDLEGHNKKIDGTDYMRSGRLVFEEGKDYNIDNKTQLPYDHIEILGQGSQCIVEKVQDAYTGNIYARKTFKLGVRKARRGQLMLFENEHMNIRGLGVHPHVIQVFATYTTKDELSLIIHPVAETDLARLLLIYSEFPSQYHRDKEFTLMTTSLHEALGCLANGLAFIHKKRVRHRDIKPSNILVHNRRIVYSDFGSSLDFGSSDHSATYGPPSGITWRYSAPEVFETAMPRNSKTDIYSLGCIFIEILFALLGLPKLDHVSGFSQGMKELHDRLDHADYGSELGFLRAIIKSMTELSEKKRPTAADVSHEIGCNPMFSCITCQQQLSAKELQQATDMEVHATDVLEPFGLEHLNPDQGKGRDESTPEILQYPSRAAFTQWIKDVIVALKRRFRRTRLDDNHFQEIDSKYFKVPVASQPSFFVTGRVFKILWAEPAAAEAQEYLNWNRTIGIRHGVMAFTQRTMMVVRNKGTFSQCIPIQTYGEGDMSQECLNMSDHGVVYTSELPPTLLPDKHLTKFSVRVEASGSETLHVGSRVNYGKLHSIEHNAKVLDVGVVTEEHKYLIQCYVDAAMRGG